jgi:hypothetical protein
MGFNTPEVSKIMVGLLHDFHLLKMPQALTLSCKLEVSVQQVEKLDAVLRAFASCCEYVNKNTNPKLTNQIAVQSFSHALKQRDVEVIGGRFTNCANSLPIKR